MADEDLECELERETIEGFKSRVENAPPLGMTADGTWLIRAPGEPKPDTEPTIIMPDGSIMTAAEFDALEEEPPDYEDDEGDLSVLDDYDELFAKEEPAKDSATIARDAAAMFAEAIKALHIPDIHVTVPIHMPPQPEAKVVEVLPPLKDVPAQDANIAHDAAHMIAETLRNMPQPVVNVNVPPAPAPVAPPPAPAPEPAKKGVERTVVTEHDKDGRIKSYERFWVDKEPGDK